MEERGGEGFVGVLSLFLARGLLPIGPLPIGLLRRSNIFCFSAIRILRLGSDAAHIHIFIRREGTKKVAYSITDI